MEINLFSQERLQEFFETDFFELLNSDHNEIDYIEQSHYGDLLIEVYESDNNRLKLWANYDGCSITRVEIEFCGALNNYRWETVFRL